MLFASTGGLRRLLREEEDEDSSGGGPPASSVRGGRSFVWPDVTPELRRVLDHAAAIGQRISDLDLTFSTLLFALVAFDGSLFIDAAALNHIRESSKLGNLSWAEVERLAAVDALRDPELAYGTSVSAERYLKRAETFAREITGPSAPVDTRHLMAVYLFDPGTHEKDLRAYQIDRQGAALSFTAHQGARQRLERARWLALYRETFGYDSAEQLGASAEGPADESESASRAPAQERVRPHADDPALVDQLSRRTFAEVLGARIEEVAGHGPGKKMRVDATAFAVHLHGPWGTGKTSVLNFLEIWLQDEKRGGPHWVVIKFNAWQQQRLQPPWWTLVNEIYAQAASQLPWWRRMQLSTRWLAWRARADWIPVLIALALLAIAIWLAFDGPAHLAALASAKAPAAAVHANPASGPASAVTEESVAKGLDLWLKVPVAVLAAAGALVTFTRSLLFGSGRAAQAYVDMRSDPLGPVLRMFGRLIRGIRRPVAVFIDDLDRCDHAFVVDLLEGLQTMFRAAPVTYVVAADRKWIASSFEKRYEQFGVPMGEPGRPLGYLFLDKIFQVATEVPRLSHDLQAGYFRSLLERAEDDGGRGIETRRATAEREATKSVENIHTHEGLQARIASADNPETELALRSAAARQTAGREAQKTAEHRLLPLTHLLESNPRAMKRLINAYAMSQAALILAGRDVQPESLARWTIMEQRWPLLTEFLVHKPHMLSAFDGSTPPPAMPAAAAEAAAARPPAPSTSLPATLAELAGNEQVAAVIGRREDGDVGVLDAAIVRLITGQRPAMVRTSSDDPESGG